MCSAPSGHICLPLLSIAQQSDAGHHEWWLRCGDRAVSGRRFHDRVALLSHALTTRLHLQVGDVVVIASLNTDLMLEAILAAADAGAVVSPINWRWSAEELASAIATVQPSLIMVDDSCLGLIRKGAPQSPPRCALGSALSSCSTCTEDLITGAAAAPTLTPHPVPQRPRNARSAAHPSSSNIADNGVAAAPAGEARTSSGVPPAPHRRRGLQLLQPTSGAALLVFTSGTTGRPKAVTLSHASLHAQSLVKLATVGYSSTDTYLHMAPLFHIGGLSSAHAALMAGCRQVLLPRFTAASALSAMQQHQVTAFIAVPTMLQDMAAVAVAAAAAAPSAVANSPRSDHPHSPSTDNPPEPDVALRLISEHRALMGGVPDVYRDPEIYSQHTSGAAPTQRNSAPQSECRAEAESPLGVPSEPGSSSARAARGVVTSRQAAAQSVHPCVRRVLIGGGATSSTMLRDTAALFPNADLWSAYGMTEACSSITFKLLHQPGISLPSSTHSPSDKATAARYPGAVCVGKPAAGLQVAVMMSRTSTADNGKGFSGVTGSSCADVEVVGDVLTRGPHVLLGYWGDAAATEQVLSPDGWLCTGDLGFLDPFGSLWLMGRAKDMIKSGGENVFCPEVEAALSSHPAVAAAAVVGLQHSRLGEMVAALVVLRHGWHLAVVPEAGYRTSAGDRPGVLLTVSLAELQAHCRAQGLSSFKLPRFAADAGAALPLTSSGKVTKPQVKALLGVAYERSLGASAVGQGRSKL
ncbi:MAG: hypothetical protein WDW38_011016 [Sanguina aurantia]